MSTVTEYAIVKRIMSVLKLDEAGKISKLYDVLVKDSKRAIAQLEANIKAQALQFEIDIDSFDERIEDAQEAVVQAFENVTLEDVSTNSKIDDFKEVYLRNIDRAETSVKMIEEEKADYTEEYDEQVKDMNEQIAAYKARIEKFTKG